MKTLGKIVLWTLAAFVTTVTLLIAGFFIHNRFFYYDEMNAIKLNLNKIKNVQVINIWGHHDLSLEEVSARIKIQGKGELILNDLNKGDFNYPEFVEIAEIGGYSFTEFQGNGGIGPGIDIGVHSHLGKIIGKKFYTVQDVINDYDLILASIQKLKLAPEINYFESENSEDYLLIEKSHASEQDPIFNLLGVENEFEFAKTLKWKRPDSWYNINK